MIPEEIADIRDRRRKMATELEKSVSVEDILDIAESAEPVTEFKEDEIIYTEEERPLIAVAKDEAFCFYYEDNLKLLADCGARLTYFSPIHDRELPKGCKGVLLGGGYPELYAQQLSENKSMLRSVREAFGNIPMVAECGGFMYLHDMITDKDGNRYPMAGVIHEDCYYTGRLVRFGYVEVNDNGRCFLKNDTSVRGHEFHYYESGLENYDCTAVKPGTDKSYSCIVAGDDHWLGFPHLYYPSNPEFAVSFVRKAREAMERELCKNYYLFGINGWIRGQE
jgi:cobyrinic acid a,c-diamide synthase